jgi:hypothetical protein
MFLMAHAWKEFGSEIKEVTMGWACNYDIETRNAYTILVGIPLGRKKKLQYNINSNISEICSENGSWMKNVFSDRPCYYLWASS